jgi:hypothetical protein
MHLSILMLFAPSYEQNGACSTGEKHILEAYTQFGVSGNTQYCLALCLRLLLGDIGFVYPVMSMMVIGPSLLY